MQKAVPLTAAATQYTSATTGRVLPFPGPVDQNNQTSLCVVLFLGIVEYSKRPVSEQLQIKERFNVHIAEAIADIAADERIVLDTGDGVAISFLGDPEDALFVATNLAGALSRDARPHGITLRGGINLGPVRLIRDRNGQPNIIGDGIDVAQRVMSFADPGKVLASRSYYEVVTRHCDDYAALFAYQGSRTDKHVREHELYEVVTPTEAASELTGRRKLAVRPRPEADEDTLAATAQLRSGVFHNRPLALAMTGFSVFALGLATLSYVTGTPAPAPLQRVAVAPTITPAISASASVATLPATPKPTDPVLNAPDVDAALPSTSAPPEGEPVAAAVPQQRLASTQTAISAEPAPAAEPVLIPETPHLEAHGEGDSPTTRPWQPAPASAQLLAPAPKPPRGPTALVLMAISPWGEVFVNGNSAGVSPPLSELELSPGKYRIAIRNGMFKPYEEDVQLGANQTIRIKHKFTDKR